MSVRVRPTTSTWGSPPVPFDAKTLCGQQALAVVLARPLPAVLQLVGHGRPMRLLELRRVIERHSPTVPAYIPRETLRAAPTEVWWTYGAERFLAVLVALGEPDRDVLGHVVVLHGRTLLDPATGARIVSPTILASYGLAIVFSAAGAQ